MCRCSRNKVENVDFSFASIQNKNTPELKKYKQMIQKKDDEILSLSDYHHYGFYCEATGLQTSRGNGKHWNMHVVHIKSHNEEVRNKFKNRIRQWTTAVPPS